MTVSKAVLPAAGLGTRFLPASKAVPKEMIPVVDRPGIQYALEEAARAGLTDVLVITGRGKSAIEDHFDRAPELEQRLEASGKKEELEEVRAVTEIADVHYIRQTEALGFGHAVSLARAHVGDEPFAVLVPDEIVPQPPVGEPTLMEAMISAYEQEGGSVLAVQPVAREAIPSYGIVEPLDESPTNVVRLGDMVEKPPPDEAPSNLAARGRYVFSPDIFGALDETAPGKGDEIQLTDAIRILARRAKVFAYVYEGRILDVGNKLDYVQATVTLALEREELAEPFREWLKKKLG
jgi:UTP--glucose-1-phosphate uridylyltransferase